MPADSQTLIFSGKKLDDNERTLTSSNVKEGDFVVIMIAKPKPVSKPEEAKEPAKSVISPAVSLEANPISTPAQTAPVQTAPV